jgi:predicted Zn-dependent protease with MMP-like domain
MHRTPPTIADIITLAEQALAAIPKRFTDHAHPLAIVVEDIADDETLDAMGIESGYDLTGLYRGTPLTLGREGSVPREPDMIILYREPILLEWIETGEDLANLVNNVLIHEVAHHFGFSDDDIEALERDD